jgi:hypothetical protein
MSIRKFKLGDRVRIKGYPFTGHTGTVIGQTRVMLTDMWVVELDQASGLGGRLFKGSDKTLRPLPVEEDPRNWRQPSAEDH